MCVRGMRACVCSLQFRHRVDKDEGVTVVGVVRACG